MSPWQGVRLFHVTLALGVCVDSVVLAEGTAATAPAEEARSRSAHARELYGQGDFDGAIREWEAVNRLVPTPELYFNIGRAQERAGHVEDAIAAYQRYLKETKDPPDRTKVEATITQLQEQLAGPRKDARQQEEAAARLKKGHELYQAGQYREALAELQAAFEILPSATMVYNMAKTREKLQDIPGALKDYRRYLAMEPTAPDRGDVEYIIRALEKKLSQTTHELGLESNPAGADVFLDDNNQLAGQTPITLKISGGAHKLKVQKNGFEVASRDFSMPEDRPLTLTFDLRPLENVGWFTVECDQDGSHIFLDGTILALTPYKERRALTSGRHQVVVEHEGYRRVVQMLEVQQGKETHLKVSLVGLEGRSKAPLVLAPVLAGAFALVAAGGTAVAAGMAWRGHTVIDGTRAWQLAMAGAGLGALVATLGVGLAVTSVVGVVGGWVALGFVGGRESQVSVRPVAVPTTEAPPKTAGGSP